MWVLLIMFMTGDGSQQHTQSISGFTTELSCAIAADTVKSRQQNTKTICLKL
jgi:hypothetical protein